MGEQKNNQNFLDKVSVTLATLFGVGYLPLMPGTWGSLAVALFYYSVPSMQSSIALVIGFIVIAYLSAGRAAKNLGQKDPGKIVIDEVAGMAIALLFIPKTFLYITLAFIFFRIFDITKIYPGKHLEKLNGSLGIVSDDIVAGIYANLATQLVILLIAKL